MTIAAKPGISTYGRGAKKRPIANPREQKSPQLTENKGKEPNSIANFPGWAALALEKLSAASGSLVTRHSPPACPERSPAPDGAGRSRRAPGPFISNRYTVRIEFAVIPSKQTTVVLSNRYSGAPLRGVGTSARNSLPSGGTRASSSIGRAGIHPRRKRFRVSSTACACSPAQAFSFRFISPRMTITPSLKQST